MAFHVRVMVLSSAHAPAATESENVIIVVGAQFSVAVAVPVDAGDESASHSTVVAAGAVTDGPQVQEPMGQVSPSSKRPPALLQSASV